MKSEMLQNDRQGVRSLFLWRQKMVLEQNWSGQKQKMGNEITEHIVEIPQEKKKRRSKDVSLE